ncbi:MAG TPA: hypothetical protein VIN93_02165 [Bryobacteraceae bacterium]
MGENLMEDAKRLRARALGILAKAEAAGQLETALKAIREVRGLLELLGKLEGNLEDRNPQAKVIQVTYVDKQLVMPAQSPASPARAELPAPAESGKTKP